uniref:Uncharacterized protein n=1 Tax=Romanomermis culicivorax TaxID=13658 RepID=A0A915IZ66_ROMCU
MGVHKTHSKRIIVLSAGDQVPKTNLWNEIYGRSGVSGLDLENSDPESQITGPSSGDWDIK